MSTIITINNDKLGIHAFFLNKQRQAEINPLQPGVAFLYPLKTSEKL